MKSPAACSNLIEKTYYRIAIKFWYATTAVGIGSGCYMIYDDAKKSRPHKLNLGEACLMGAGFGILTFFCSVPLVMYWPIAMPPIVVVGGLSMIDVNVR